MQFDGCNTTQPRGISGKVFTDRGTGVRIKSEDFMKIVSKTEEPLVVETAEGFFTKIYKYATAYKGFVFFTESLNRLQFTAHTEIIQAQSISSDI